MNPILIISIAILITIIGALPLGLVNLTVLHTSYRNGQCSALQISRGAAIVEVLFGLTALMAGGIIAQYTRNNEIIQFTIMAVPAVVGIFFLLKKNQNTQPDTGGKKGFFKGVLLNFISFQVLLYWLLAMTYMNSIWNPEYTIFFLAIFALGIWLGKMGVLWAYAYFSKRIFRTLSFLSKNINRIIGIVLLLTVIIQFLKFTL